MRVKVDLKHAHRQHFGLFFPPTFVFSATALNNDQPYPCNMHGILKLLAYAPLVPVVLCGLEIRRTVFPRRAMNQFV